MAYLSEDDYTISISKTNLDEILTQAADTSGFSTDQVRQNAELTAQAEMRAYLYPIYAIDGEFQKSSPDTSRERLTIKMCVDIALYNIHFSVTPRDVPDSRKRAYDSAIEMLKAFRDGHLVSALPRTPVSVSGGARNFEIYSERKFISKQFDDSLLLNPDQTTTP